MKAKTTSYLSPKLEAQPRPGKGGFGVYAQQPVQKGELLAVWGGRVVDADELAQLPSVTQRHSIQVEDGFYLVPISPAEPADYVNHSCDPNAGMAGQISLAARRDIQPGEEVNYDYAMSDGSDYDEFVCSCGAANCRGRITGEDWRDPTLQERYAGYFSPYLQRRIDRLRE